MDEIAARTRTTKRMIYYYFGGKEQLYTAVLERAYAEIRGGRAGHRRRPTSTPVAAIRRLAELTFDHHESHPDFIRLVSIENIHRAEHIDGRARRSPGLNTPAIDLIERILERGREDGVFRRDIDAIDVHMLISSFCVFRVANRHTFGAIFGRDLARRRPGASTTARMLGDVVVDLLRGPQ